VTATTAHTEVASSRPPFIAVTTLVALAGGGIAVAAGAGSLALYASVAIMLVAAAEDVRTRRIRNAFVAPALVLALLAALASDALPSALIATVVAPLPFLVMALLAPGGMGMGDVKLASPAGAVAGIGAISQLWIAIAVLGGVLALVGALRHGRRATIAYGPAIAGAVVIVLLQS
jgi:leader peptidase (prepilin peptidase)/N-methyltransferase